VEHEGKVAFITGGARGFGFGFAKALSKAGAAVVIADIDSDKAASSAEDLRKLGARALAIGCDVTDELGVNQAIARTEAELGGLNILINNAGFHKRPSAEDFSTLPRAIVRAVLDVNIMGVVNCSIAARSAMARRGGGVVLNIASIAGYSVIGPYGLSKLAVRGLTVSLAREFASDSIRVVGIAPGLMATETIMADLPADMINHFVNDLQVIKRQGLPQDIVEAAMFLCSDRASFITGETLRVSGGYPLEV
jgi:3-oxoacyl-[acyl-carrier protein] reductase